MISPAEAAIAQVDITNVCFKDCANCTRHLGLIDKKYIMTVDQFEEAIKSIASFPYREKQDKRGRRKLVGLIGGEPTMHPQFPDIVDVMCKYIPDRNLRGLWTSRNVHEYKHPRWGSLKDQVRKLLGPDPEWNMKGPSSRYDCGYLNNNLHDYENGVYCEHAPLLIDSETAVPNRKKRWELIRSCRYQTDWSPTITVIHGEVVGFFCEVSAHLCLLLSQKRSDGTHAEEYQVGLPVSTLIDGRPWWNHPLSFVVGPDGVPQPKGVYAKQIFRSCEDCGGCLNNMPPRRDGDELYDLSPRIHEKLVQINPRKLVRGEVVVHQDVHQIQIVPYNPLKYLKGANSPEGIQKEHLE